MLFTTPEQFIVLAAVLLGGWLLGYVSAPSPKKVEAPGAGAIGKLHRLS